MRSRARRRCNQRRAEPGQFLRQLARASSACGRPSARLVEVAFEDDRVRVVREREQRPPTALVGSVLGLPQRDGDDGRDLVQVE